MASAEFWIEWVNYNLEMAEWKEWFRTNETFVIYKDNIELVMEDL